MAIYIYMRHIDAKEPTSCMKITLLRPTLESDGLLSKQNKLKKWIGFNTT